MRKHRAKVHLGQGRHHGLRHHRDTLDPDLSVQHGWTVVENRQGCLHAGPLLLPLLQLRLLLLRREANAGQRGTLCRKVRAIEVSPHPLSKMLNRV